MQNTHSVISQTSHFILYFRQVLEEAFKETSTEERAQNIQHGCHNIREVMKDGNKAC